MMWLLQFVVPVITGVLVYCSYQLGYSSGSRDNVLRKGRSCVGLSNELRKQNEKK